MANIEVKTLITRLVRVPNPKAAGEHIEYKIAEGNIQAAQITRQNPDGTVTTNEIFMPYPLTFAEVFKAGLEALAYVKENYDDERS